jgi:dihydrofolate reductase
MIISIIAAVTENNVIGNNGNLPFKQKDDLLRFKIFDYKQRCYNG